MGGSRSLSKTERALDHIELAIVSHPNWVLANGTEVKSSRKASSTLIHGDIPPAPLVHQSFKLNLFITVSFDQIHRLFCFMEVRNSNQGR